MDAEPSGVDRSLIEEYLRLTPRERLERAVGWARFVEQTRGARVVRVGIK